MPETLTPALRKLGRPIRLGMVGGGRGSWIGAAHRHAARIDGKYTIEAGAFDLDPAKGQEFASELFVAPDRAYATYRDLIREESGRPDRVELVSVLTPNHTHYEITAALLANGFHVMCEKPLTTSFADASALYSLARDCDRVLAVNYGYSGYPMIRQARDMVAAGDFGRVRLVEAEFAVGVPGSMSDDDHWRTKPGLAGPSAVLGMIGVHAYHLACFVTGLRVEALCAELSTFAAGRQLEDNAQVLVRFSDGARGSFWFSYVAAGLWHGLRLRVFGDRGGFEWVQEDPNVLLLYEVGRERRVITRSGPLATPSSMACSRLAGGHPEGFIEAVANIYGEVAEAVAARGLGLEPVGSFPDALDGLMGVQFVDSALESGRQHASWVPVAKPPTESTHTIGEAA